jgi:acetylornithine deacetylase/succinyl-diaminopimelate desuccinylase-like protein
MSRSSIAGGAFLVLFFAAGFTVAQEVPAPDWPRVGARAAGLLSKYIQIDTRNPPGRTVEAADFLEKLLRESGLQVERTGGDPEKPIVVGRLHGTDRGAKPIVLLNHMDVVPTDAARWSFPPLSGEISDGVVHGRGALDMKGFGIIELMALRLLARRGERPSRDVVFLAVPDEEVGGDMGTAWLAQNRPDLMDAYGVWDEGGIGLSDALSVPAMFISVTEKQVLWLKLIAEGPAGHGSRPIPNAAPRRLEEGLQRIFADLPAPRLTPLSRQVFRRIGSAVGGFEGFALRRLKNPIVWLFADGLLQQDPLTSALVRDTIALTMLRAGYKPNVIPEHAEAVLDCRLLPDTDRKEFLSHLRKTIDDPAIRIEILQDAPAQPPPASPTDHPLFEAIEEVTHEVYPKAMVMPFMTVAGTDSRFFRRRGVPAYGFIPVQVSEKLLPTFHGIDERIPVDVLGPAVRVVYGVLKRM